MSPRLEQRVLRYGLPVLSVLAATGLTIILTAFLHENRTLSVFFFGAVMLSTWFGGLTAGLLTTALSLISIDLFFIGSVGHYTVPWYDLPLLAVFCCLSLLIAHIVDSRRRAELALRIANERLELRVAERTLQLEEANRVKDRFLGMVSHDLRSPLTSILGWLKIIEQDVDSQTYRKALSIIKRNALMQLRLVNDLLDATGMAATGIQLNVQLVELSELIESIKQRFQPLASERRIRLDVLIDPDLIPIRVDPDRLCQALDNLISNAIKFTPDDGRVSIQVKTVGNQLHISVSDTGEGIAPEALPHVFDEFFQENKKNRQGIGLGLAIVKHIITAHGGTVEANSCGKGSTFTIALPGEARIGSRPAKHLSASA